MAEETKKRAMDLDGDGKVTAKEALEYSTGKIKEAVNDYKEDLKEAKDDIDRANDVAKIKAARAQIKDPEKDGP